MRRRAEVNEETPVVLEDPETAVTTPVAAVVTLPPAPALQEPPVWIAEEDGWVNHGGRRIQIAAGSGYEEERYGASTLARWRAGGLPMRRALVGE